MAKHDNTKLRSKPAFVQQSKTYVPRCLCRSVPPCILIRHRLLGSSEPSQKCPRFTDEPSIWDFCPDVLAVSSEDAHVPMNCHVYREVRGAWKL